MKIISRVLAGLGIGAIIVSFFIGIPVLSGEIDAAAWAFIAALFAMAAWARTESK